MGLQFLNWKRKVTKMLEHEVYVKLNNYVRAHGYSATQIKNVSYEQVVGILEQLDVDAHGRVEARLCAARRALRMQVV